MGSMPAHLDSHHRQTVEKIFAHPTSGNIEWRQVESLLAAIGTITPEHDGKLHVRVGAASEVVFAPHGKDADVQTVGDLRHLLTGAGLDPGASTCR